MAIQFPIPEGLSEIWSGGRKWLIDALGNVLDPNKLAQPPIFQGMEAGPMPGPPQTLPQMIASGIMPETPKEAYESGIIGMGPMPAELATNYRTPEAIQALRRAMAAENRARGAVKWSQESNPATILQAEKNIVSKEVPDIPDGEFDALKLILGKYPKKTVYENVERYAPIGEANYLYNPDPIDQILRGSWFHGMRPEARGGLTGNQIIGQTEIERAQYPLRFANAYGLPGSTHATPSYTRFGEPYGVSISASPSIARNFSADEYIHRVQPLYGGPPTERIIPMWRPEGQKAMNEGYNTALNQLAPELYVSKYDPTSGMKRQNLLESIADELQRQSNPNSAGLTVEQLINRPMSAIQSSQTSAEQFNTLYSKALQDKGYRGILYSPQRYGEYEMLMLDPSYVRPLDYRPVKRYQYLGAGYDKQKKLAYPSIAGETPEMMMTPGAARGYSGAAPEFATGATRLSDVFSQQSWVDRINEENKRRIAEMIDAQYREQVINQLFGNR